MARGPGMKMRNQEFCAYVHGAYVNLECAWEQVSDVIYTSNAMHTAVWLHCLSLHNWYKWDDHMLNQIQRINDTDYIIGTFLKSQISAN